MAVVQGQHWDPLREEEDKDRLGQPTQFEDPFLRKVSDGFLGINMVEPQNLLFPDDQEAAGEEGSLSIWNDVDWWTGEDRSSPEQAKAERRLLDQMTVTREERRVAEETFASMSDPGSSGSFQAAQAATMPSVKQGKEIRWFKQENGKIPFERMVNVGGDNYLRPSAARAYKAMKRAAKKDGVTITLSSESGSGYRDYDTQVRLRAEKPTLAAVPGTSNHGWGMAIDVGPVDARQWIAKHGAKFGYHVLPSESWHFDFKPDDRMEFKLPRRKNEPQAQPQTRVKAQPGRHVGAKDLTDTIPLSSSGGFTEAVLSLLEDDVQVQTAKGKKTINLSDAPQKLNTRDEIVAFARRVARKYGWTGDDWLAINAIIDGGRVGNLVVPSNKAESHWDPKADNPESTATGIPQRLLSAHPFAPGEAKKWKDPRYQIRWLMRYINGRYDGDAMAALRFKVQNGWY